MHLQKNDPIRLLIVDDHPVVCAGLVSMLASHEELEVIGSVSSGERALAVIRQKGPAVILLDLRMPGMDGIAVLHALKSMASRPQALILTSFEKDEDIYRAIRAGAAAGTVTAKFSLADRPLVSVAVTFKARLSIPAGTVPIKVRVAALKLSQAGTSLCRRPA